MRADHAVLCTRTLFGHVWQLEAVDLCEAADKCHQIIRLLLECTLALDRLISMIWTRLMTC